MSSTASRPTFAAQSDGSSDGGPLIGRFVIGDAATTIVAAVSGTEVREIWLPWLVALQQMADGSSSLLPSGQTYPLALGRFDVPVDPTGRGLFCAGMNYRHHRAEVDLSLGSYADEKPIIFSKVPESLVAAGEPLRLPFETSVEFDWEVELGVVIGKTGRRIDANRAKEHVAGYTLVNDITARDVQRAHSQWFLGKNVHRSTPVGPLVLQRDVLAWPPSAELRLSVNGDVKQSADTAEMVHGVAQLIETISRYVELQVGDVIATGSPAGVGFTRQPPEFLRPGDVVRAELVGFMAMENVIE